jgi:hypothetical protein
MEQVARLSVRAARERGALGPEGPGFKSRRPDYMSQVVSAFGGIVALGLSTQQFRVSLEKTCRLQG